MPCGWGIHEPTLKKACELAQLDGDFVIESFEKVKFGNVIAKADLCCFDKPAFIKACLEGFVLNQFKFPGGNFDTIIDATAGRNVIGFCDSTEQLTIYTRQVRLKREEIPVERMEIEPLQGGGVGYVWRFPLGREVHYGLGIVERRIDRLPDWFLPANKQIICSCKGMIRASSPKYSEPVWGHAYPSTIIAVGESAGMISSVTGGGCKEAIDGVEILIKNWGDWDKYEKELVKEFKWADREYEIVKKLYQGKKLSIGDYRTIQKNSKRVGFRLGIKETVSLVKHILTGGNG
jgi:flavin-dependent dehydrogenase